MAVSRQRIIAVQILVTIFLLGVFFTVFLYILSTRHEITKTNEEVPPSTKKSITTESTSTIAEVVDLPPQKVLFQYIEVTDGCGPHFTGECLRVRSGPGTDFPVVAKLRNGMVLKVNGTEEGDGLTWYKVVFDEWLRYPERMTDEWYVAADYVREFSNGGDEATWGPGSTTVAENITKKIIVERGTQQLRAYDGETLFMEIPISTGLELTPTPRGTFSVFKKTPSRYMQGPLPGLVDQDIYDLPGVPWNLYFTEGGAVIHGAYWHDSFGTPYSHGCVNLSPSDAQKLYMWAELGTEVVVKD